MINKLFAKGPTDKKDVLMACAGALVGVWKAFDTFRDYKTEQDLNKEITK